MNHKDFFKLLKSKDFLIALFDLVFLIAPGFLIVYIFFQDLFLKIDATKLILFSISITGPFYFVSILLENYFSEEKKDYFWDVSLGIIMTGLVFYLSLIIYYLFIQPHWFNASFYEYVKILMGVEIIYLLLILIENKKGKEKKLDFPQVPNSRE